MGVGNDASQIPAVVRHIRSQKGTTWSDKVTAWQESYNAKTKGPKLKVDGIVGSKTKSAMADSDPSGSDNDYNYKPQASYARQAGSTLQQRTSAGRKFQNQLANISKQRESAANRSLAYTLKEGEKTETLYERMKGDKNWASRYRKELQENKTKPVSAKTGTGGRSSDLGPRPSNKKYPSEKATVKNLRPWERANLEKLALNAVTRNKGKKK